MYLVMVKEDYGDLWKMVEAETPELVMSLVLDATLPASASARHISVRSAGVITVRSH